MFEFISTLDKELIKKYYFHLFGSLRTHHADSTLKRKYEFADYLSTRIGRFEDTEFSLENTNCLLFEVSCVSKSSPSEQFLGIGVQKMSSKFTGDQPCRSVISLKLICNFIEIALRHGCSPVNFFSYFQNIFL